MVRSLPRVQSWTCSPQRALLYSAAPHRPLADAFEAEQADLAKAGVEVGQDIDGLRHLGQRIAASVKGIADKGHGVLRRIEGI